MVIQVDHQLDLIHCILLFLGVVNVWIVSKIRVKIMEIKSAEINAAALN